ncbi:MAG: RHS repeat-associated core domain-containing protein [Pseudomonadota bacterium]
MSNNRSSRFMGAFTRSDDSSIADCDWTRYRYICPEPGQSGGINPCGTIIPGYVLRACPSGYLATGDGYCRLNAARERDCDPCDPAGKPNPKTDNPIIVSTGSKYLEALDYSTADGLFRIGRQYRSFQVGTPMQERVLPRAQLRGLHGQWNFEFMREVQFGILGGTPASPNATVAFLLPNGTGYGFKLKSDGTWAEEGLSAAFATSSGNIKLELVGALPSDLSSLRNAPTTWRVTDQDDTVWTLVTSGGANSGKFLRGWPTSMVTRSGYTQTFTYGSDGRLDSLTDSFGRTATFDWREFDLTTRSTPPAGLQPEPIAVEAINLPDGTRLEYSYETINFEPVTTGYYSGTKWQTTWRGGSGGFTARVNRTHLPKRRKLTHVNRLSGTGDQLDSVEYLYENDVFSRSVTGIVDHRGERVGTFEYDSAGRVVSSELADGVERNTIAYSKVGSDRVRTVTNELGKQTDFTFSEFSGPNREYQLTSIDGAATSGTQANTTTLSYSGGTFLTSSTDAEGRLITTSRDSRGRPLSIVEASGTPDERTTTVTWHPDFNVPITTVTDNLTETRSYDAQGRLTSLTLTDTTSHALPYATNGQTRTYSYTWDANGRLLSENGPLAAVGAQDDLTTFTYDASGNMLSQTNALGHVTTYAGHDANGRPGSMTDANGAVTQFTYDLLGRVETITVKHPSNPALDATTSMTYDAVGNVTQMTLPGTSALTMAYDANNRLTSMTSASGERFDYAYDVMGNVERETVVRGDGSTSRLIRRQFDELGRLIGERLGVKQPVKLGYDRVDNLTSLTDEIGFATTSSFDALDRVASVVAPDGGSQGSTYDEQNNPLTFTDPISVTTQFTYNGFGDVIQEVSPDRGTSAYEYDAAGRMTKSTDGRGQVIDYTRDILGRVTRMEPVGRPASELIEYVWDAGGLAGSYETGRLAKVVDGSGTTLFQYDHRGNRTAKQQVIGTSAAAQLAYEYDVADRITQITYPSGRLVRYGYDAYGRVNLVETKQTAASPAWETIADNHDYEPFGPAKAMDLGNGLAVANDWGTDGRLAARRLYTSVGGTDLSHLAYRRDDAGRIGAIADYVNPAGSVIYGYDEVGRLELAVSDGASTGSESYTYTNGTNQLASFTDANGTRTISYDARGNTVSEARPGGTAVTATYDGHGRLATYDRTNIGVQTYTYNGLGDRVRVDKPTGTRHFVYDAWGRVVAEYGASASDVKAEFIWALPPAANDNSPFGGGDHIAGYAPLALVAENASSQLELYRVHGNHLGVPVVTTNAAGQVVTPGNDFLRPGFPGQSEVLSDLYYNRARDYDPSTGRYIQADPIGLGGGSNPYVYAFADPVNLIDPSGEVPAAIVVPIIVGGANLAYQLYQNGGRWDCVDPWEVADWALIGTGLGGWSRLIGTKGGRKLLKDLWRDERGGGKLPHGNSLDFIGETHVYAIKGPNGYHKIGESMLGVTRKGISRRGGAQARRLERKTNNPYRSQIRKTFSNKRDARNYERRLIERYRRMYGDHTLPGNKTNR